jgi:hypothetical protein
MRRSRLAMALAVTGYGLVSHTFPGPRRPGKLRPIALIVTRSGRVETPGPHWARPADRLLRSRDHVGLREHEAKTMETGRADVIPPSGPLTRPGNPWPLGDHRLSAGQARGSLSALLRPASRSSRTPGPCIGSFAPSAPGGNAGPSLFTKVIPSTADRLLNIYDCMNESAHERFGCLAVARGHDAPAVHCPHEGGNVEQYKGCQIRSPACQSEASPESKDLLVADEIWK